MQGKGFTAMMPSGTADALVRFQQQGAGAIPPPHEAPPLPAVVPTAAPEPAPAPASVRAPALPSKTAPPPEPNALQSQATEGALAETRKQPSPPSPLLLVGIAAGCLIAGILLTMVVMRLFG